MEPTLPITGPAPSPEGTTADRTEVPDDTVRSATGENTTPTYRIDLAKVAPVLLTCARQPAFVAQFVASYRTQVGSALPPPTLVVDLTASHRLPASYCRLLQQLDPAAVYLHPRPHGFSDYYSVQDAAYVALQCAWDELADREFVLFLEDDVVFSSQWVPFLTALHCPEDTGLYSFYLPGSGFGAEVVEPYRYYGTLCVLLPRRSVQLLLANRVEIERRYAPGYDQQWANYLGSAGLRIRTAPRSYVQHIGIPSRIGSGLNTTSVFVP